MAAKTNTVTVLDHFSVAPPVGTTVNHSLTLTFFDIYWLYFSPIERLIFYESPLSRTRFAEEIIPTFKNSLSLTLKHFFPLAGNLVIPTDSGNPEIRYLVGDSVSLIFAESDYDFNTLIENHPRMEDLFHPLVPPFPKVKKTESLSITPVLAVQVTLFPDYGFCIGISHDHAVGDGSSIFNFMKAWAAIAKIGEDTDGSFLQPLYNRNLIKHPHGLRETILSQVSKMFIKASDSGTLPPTSVRGTFIMRKDQIQKLKRLASTQRPELRYVSSFTVVCAYVWSCKVRSQVHFQDSINEDEVDHFVCVADCRARLDHPLPATYFGNCLVLCPTTGKTIRLASGKEGFLAAVELVGEAICERLYNKEEGVLKGAERWITDVLEFNWQRFTGVAGSPKFDYYDLDFGWGKGKKMECVSIAGTTSMSVHATRQSKEDIEVGLYLPKNQMDAFISIFVDGLEFAEVNKEEIF